MSFHEMYTYSEDRFPEEQSPEDILRLLDRAKTGDYAHLFPQGDKQIFCLENGLPQVWGAVEEESPKGQVTLWGTLFAMPFANKAAFAQKEARTFGVVDISLMRLTPAEIIIPRMSEGKFSYLGKATTIVHGHGEQLVTIDTLADGYLSGKNQDGIRVTGGMDRFHPVR